MTTAITTHRLRKEFGQRCALEDLDLEIPTGAIFGVIGHNGAGKTTLMRILLDIVRPTAGTATVLGANPRESGAQLRQRIGYLPGELRLNPQQTGADHLRFWASLAAQPESTHAEALRLAEQLEVRLGEPTRKLSKGNKQKLGIIQAFMHRPELVILDEPTSGLDPLVQQQVLGLVSEAREGGATVFLSSHVMSEIEQIADTAAVLNHGRLVDVAPMSELRASAARHVQAIVRDSEADVVALLGRFGLALDVAGSATGEPAITGVREGGRSTPAGPGRVGETIISGLLEGRPNDLVAALAELDVVSLVVAEPDLEERVLGMYEAGEADDAATHGASGLRARDRSHVKGSEQ